MMLSRTRVAQLLMVVVLATDASAQDLVLEHATIIHPAESRVVSDGMIVVRDGKIVHVGARIAVPPDVRTIDLEGRWVMPGLIDAHVHIGGLGAARRALRSGVTTVRSMGVPADLDVGIRDLASRYPIEAPEMVASGYHIRPQLDETFFLDHPEMGDLLGNDVRGVDALRRVANAILASRVDVLKVVATDRAGLATSDPRRALYSEAEIAAVVDEAARAGIGVAVHAHGDGGARAAVLAGARSIEHGTYLTDETLDLMKERGTYLVPTLAVVRDLSLPGGDYDNSVLQIRGAHMYPRVLAMARRAHTRGIPIVAATDTGYGSNSVLRIGQELVLLVEIGMSPMEALQAATNVAAALLGVEDHTGRLVAGLDADLVVFDDDPLLNIGVVQDVLVVITDGRVVVDRLAGV